MFFSVQNYTTYSILSGIKEPKEWVSRAKELNHPALAIVDKGTVSGWVEHQELCEKAGIKPVFGWEILIAKDCHVKETGSVGNLILYVKDQTGYRNLTWLNNHSQTRVEDGGGFYYRPRLDIDTICSKAEGLVCVLPANDGAYLVPNSSHKGFVEAVEKLQQAFGDDFYLGYNPLHVTEEWEERVALLLDEGAPWVPTYNCHYPAPDDVHLYDVVRKMDHSSHGQNRNLDRKVKSGFLPEMYAGDYAGDSLQRMFDSLQYRMTLGQYQMPKPELLVADTEELETIAYLCQGIRQKLLPDFPADEIYEIGCSKDNPIGYVADVVRTQFGDRISAERLAKYPDQDAEKMVQYADRLEHEFNVIAKLGFLDYFLIVRDICEYSDSIGDRGAARGSAAGSVFSYLLNITKVDPIEHRLPFWRFLTEDRVDLPDIDLDFSTETREQIKEYIGQKYGQGRVCSIGSYNRLKIPSCIKLYCQAFSYGIPDNKGDIVVYDRFRINQICDEHVAQTARGEKELEERLEDETFAKFYKKHSNFFDTIVMPLLESAVSPSIHPSGVVIATEDIDDCLPVTKRSTGLMLTQWKDRHCESAGFPKFDILGLKAVNMITYTNKLIKKRHGVTPPDIDQIPLNDPKVFEVFCKAATEGVFQFGSFTQKTYLPRLQPDVFEDLVAATALCRPGPQRAMADQEYIEIKHNRRPAEYDHPDIKPITEPTYGLLVYQEQIMQIVQEMGGLTPTEADYVRKACSKKQLDKMQVWEQAFKDGSKERGYADDVVNRMWDKIVAFAEYSFNLAHAVSYTLMGYHHAWLKAHYPVEFWCAVLKYAKDNNALFQAKEAAAAEGFSFIYPTISGFANDFSPASDTEIYWPLNGIKGIGEVAKNIVTNDGERNSFQSLDDMITTLDTACNLGVYKKLIMAGFFDELADRPWQAATFVLERRNELLNKKDEVPYEMQQEDELWWHIGRNDTYGFVVRPWKSLGAFHPNLQSYSEAEFSQLPDGSRVFVGGYVEDIRVYEYKPKKKGQKYTGRFYAKALITDEGEKYQVYIWTNCWSNEKYDRERRRPYIGDLVELIGEKGSFNDRAKVDMNGSDNYMKVIR